MARRERRGSRRTTAREERRARQRAKKRLRRWVFLAIAGTAAIAIIVGLFLPSFIHTGGPSTPAFERGGPGEHPPVQPATHITPGQSHPAYSSSPPTSGWHYGFPDGPANWGIYQAPLLDEVTIHNLEHGGVSIFYDTEDQELVAQLEDLARSQRGFPCYLLVAPRSNNVDHQGVEHPIALAAWGAVKYFDAYDEAAMEEFIDFYRNQGPEQVPCQP